MIINKRKAFTMIEMIISMSIVAIFIIAIAFSINKREQQRLGMPIGGTYICYKDANNALHSKTEIRYADTTQVTEGVGDNCVFELPQNVNNFKLALIGGGGGAGAPAANEPVVEYSILQGGLISPFTCVFDSADGSIFQREYCKTGVPCEVSHPVATQNVSSVVENQLSQIMEDDVYESLFLRNIGVSVQGGRDLYGNAGATCQVRRDFQIGDEVLCINGASEVGTDVNAGLAEGNWTSSTKGLLRVNGRDLISAQGRVAYTQYSGLGGDYSLTPSCRGGEPSNNLNGINYMQIQYDGALIESISVPKGLAGSAGEYIERLNQRASDISVDGIVTIEAENIGNGGLAAVNGVGNNGGDTKFELINLGEIVAVGGAGGLSTEEACRVEISKIDVENLNDREHPNSECYVEGDEARVSRYVEETLFPTLSELGQSKYISKSGFCENECEDAQNSEKVSYGNGGSAGAFRVIYDYVKQFKLVDNLGNDIISTPLHDIEFEYSSGANGSGGAIIISW